MSIVNSARSILDAFTIFPFAIVLALALSEAFKSVIIEDDVKFIAWSKLYALASFLFLVLPFYQGMNKYLLSTYGVAAKSTPSSIFLIVDGIAFMAESALFFVMSRTLAVASWKRFYWTVFILLMVDSAWGLTVRMHPDPDSSVVIGSWTILNLVTSIVILLLIQLGPYLRKMHAVAAIAAFAMLVRTILDYWISWHFYFLPIQTP